MIITNPVNVLVPLAAEILRKHEIFDARRLCGVTTLDVVRAETFLAEMLGTTSEAAGMRVDVIGGHSSETMVPLFSQVDMAQSLASDQVDKLIYRELLTFVLISLRFRDTTHTGVDRYSNGWL